MDEKYMEKGLELAIKGWGKTNPNPLVGAVIVKDDRVIGEGFHEVFGGQHAEVVAINDAGDEAKGSTIYVTLEPCSHYGKTPPCVEKIIEAKIGEVVIARKDPNENVSGKGIKRLKDAGIKVKIGVKEKEAKILNDIFEKYIQTKRPFVILKWAMSLDGKIASHTGDSKWITNDKAREDVHLWRARTACIMVGIQTVIKDDPMLTCRHPLYTYHHPVRIVLDSELKIPLDSNLVSTAKEIPTIVATTNKAPEAKKEKLNYKGVEIITCSCKYPEKEGEEQVDIEKLLNLLGTKGYDSILIEGGQGVHGKFVDLKLADKVICYIGSKVVGGVSAITSVGGAGTSKIKDALELCDMDVRMFDGDIRVTGYPVCD
ncbi:bifunctional diaminohydroxyphosphoribosylaminopyrimidine deaminase/5-amino-6-(5-phosphoribosylamino)uracil reductase RibD [Natranaerofaba carboxydovora]|uniref:bifunctional diaminohydroxyphosphoribosylaminopyrimidine deaminase/5-amino-6-(5-phosphoribosylamino)uracil reductase RibD n=1 Tax=Natranaerofaba carboxydovora TaxID=2742683 RepID=UPI003B848140